MTGLVPCRNDHVRPVRCARWRHRAGRFRPTRRLTIKALAAGTLIAAFDPGFGQGPAAR
jgi:hypothetical protein